MLRPSVAAAQNVDSPLLEEIRVVAQKREESLQEVPLAVTYLSGAGIDDSDLNTIADIAGFVPNFTTTETAASTQMYLRGIGSGNNPGFEQSVGQYIDGVYYGRAQLIRMPFFDLEHIEVLHGPQSILFGQNTIAGALNLLSRQPTSGFTADVRVLREFETGQDELNAALSGPLGAGLRGRIALRSYRDDGYMANPFKNRSEPERDEQAVRVMLDWDISPRLQASLKLEHNRFDGEGRQMEILRDEPNLFPPGSTPIAGLNFAQILPLFGQAAHDPEQNFVRGAPDDEYSDNAVNNLTLDLTWDLDRLRLQALSAWVEYDFDDLCDCDTTPADIFSSRLSEDYRQFSQEIRVSSLQQDNHDWVAGWYYQTSDFDYREQVRVSTDSLFGQISPQTAPMRGTVTAKAFDQDSDTWALFGQYLWRPADELRVTLGARYSREEKAGARRVDILDLATGTITANPFAPFVYEGVFGIQNQQGSGHAVNGARDESSFIPSLTLEYDATPEAMLYAGVRRGFKPGGFDARSNRTSHFSFDGEDATYYELGWKSSLADGRAELNLALHHADYENLQISQFDGQAGFNVGNARRSVVRGVDLNGRWRATDTLELQYALAYLDFEFRDFRNGNCYTRQVPNGNVVDGVPLCDYTGSRGKYTPETRANLSFIHRRAIGSRFTLHTTLALLYTGSQIVHENLDPAYDIDAYTRVNLRLALEAERWTLALLGKNLLDESIITYAANVPLTDGLFGTNTYYGFLERPRTLALEATLRY